jgi:hypothetical protein
MAESEVLIYVGLWLWYWERIGNQRRVKQGSLGEKEKVIETGSKYDMFLLAKY